MAYNNADNSEQKYRQNQFNKILSKQKFLDKDKRALAWDMFNHGVTSGMKRKWKYMLVSTRLSDDDSVNALRNLKIILDDYPDVVDDIGERSIITAMDNIRLLGRVEKYLKEKGLEEDFNDWFSEEMVS